MIFVSARVLSYTACSLRFPSVYGLVDTRFVYTESSIDSCQRSLDIGFISPEPEIREVMTSLGTENIVFTPCSSPVRSTMTYPEKAGALVCNWMRRDKLAEWHFVIIYSQCNTHLCKDRRRQRERHLKSFHRGIAIYIIYWKDTIFWSLRHI